MECTIMGTHFPSKKVLTEYCQDVVRTAAQTEKLIEGENRMFLAEVLSHHPEFFSKIGNGMVRLGAEFAFKSARLFFERKDGADLAISYHRAIRHLGKNDALYFAAGMRTHRQRINVAEKARGICSRCDKRIYVNGVVVYEEKSLDQLVHEFLKHHVTAQLPSSFDKMDIEFCHVPCFKAEDTGFAGEWQDFHEAQAKLAYHCFRCVKEAA